MKRVVKHIEQLLYQEECVVVPGLGAFIRHHQSATTDLSKGLIYPGRSEVTFNAALSQSDGLLVQSYSKAFSFGYKKALALLESDVQELKASLAEFGVVQLGQIGKLTQDRSDGLISFIPNPDHPFSIECYGLQPVAILPRVQNDALRVAQPSSSRKRKDIYYLPINLRAVKYGAAAVVVTALALLIPTQKLSNPSSDKIQYQAGFLTTQQKVKEASPQKSAPAEALKVTATESSAEAATQKQFKEIHLPIGEQRFYVVIASLSTEEQYQKFLQDHQKNLSQLNNAGVIISKTFYRVFADGFDTVEEANKFLNQLSKNPDYSSAWVYKTK